MKATSPKNNLFVGHCGLCDIVIVIEHSGLGVGQLGVSLGKGIYPWPWSVTWTRGSSEIEGDPIK